MQQHRAMQSFRWMNKGSTCVESNCIKHSIEKCKDDHDDQRMMEELIIRKAFFSIVKNSDWQPKKWGRKLKTANKEAKNTWTSNEKNRERDGKKKRNSRIQEAKQGKKEFLNSSKRGDEEERRWKERRWSGWGGTEKRRQKDREEKIMIQKEAEGQRITRWRKRQKKEKKQQQN